ncbi:hypothetical protein [Bacillus sp. B15-48]|uniref:hypothetical protein n=1 Tax=Bacillus sp. B15-48 TaxID=1548601 RepID=UPI0019401EDF|nr:hypothetical protein [Bacillus sp. B15-48]MBM4761857.1 hypothetical protein [Bacillus sp. B15-48]
MKITASLIMVIIIMHTITLVNVTIFDGEWNGIVLALSSILFLVAIAIFGVDRQRNRHDYKIRK